ncbi:hypothetical protein AYM40_30520 [Paraburkholderia phytofirmans OLGA172]|uniref:HTH lysR-type domain-containing protein n=1 Tax=Paraburkholderia phytofirmans OLGA172 TaxID=1417228 RepID=A0A160FUF8_9BURK|nr:LysR family transcriptional regulator [Paraburkholderia phytofirmans]ANB76536.1 hypothetical protein AYM40_30520 [Paraburkholderia phytofirmans OLGA172]
MDTRRIEIFLAVCEEMNLREAARRLGISQPAVTFQLQALEAELGFSLLQRVQQRIVGVTPSGAHYRRIARALLSELQAAQRSALSISGGKTVAFRIGIAEEVATDSPYWAAFLALQREFDQIAFLYVEMPIFELETAVRDGSVDLALTVLEPASNGLETTELWSQNWVAVLPKGHALGSFNRLTPEDFANVPLVLGDPTKSAGGHVLIEQSFLQANITPQIAMRVTRRSTMLILVAAGGWATFMPEYLSTIRLPDLDMVPFDAEPQRIRALSLGPRAPSWIQQFWSDLRERTQNFTYA